MNKIQRISSLRAAISGARKDKKTVALVPTMGNLHDGHLELVRIAKRHADLVIVSSYVNPTQFGQNEDLDNYPSTPEEDGRLLAEEGVDILFIPENEVMYPGGVEDQTIVYVPKLGQLYCGMDRKNHFQGVTTVVSKLFNIVQPNVALFGKKDYQQLAIIKRLVRDMSYPIEVVGVETVREESGLALSSRNFYLNKIQLKKAPLLQAALLGISNELKARQLKKSVKTIEELEQNAHHHLEKAGFQPHYITVCRQADLQPAIQGDTKLVILAAATLGKARLIDNLEVVLDDASS